MKIAVQLVKKPVLENDEPVQKTFLQVLEDDGVVYEKEVPSDSEFSFSKAFDGPR